MQASLSAWAKIRKYRVAWGPPSIAVMSKAEISHRAESGEIDSGLFNSEFAPLVEKETFPEEVSLILVAVPRPAHRVSFELPELGRLEAILPPTYVRYQMVIEEVRQDLARNALPGAHVEHLHGPCKAMAARLGLVRYGRNNITYASGMGSYLQLCGFITDAALPRPSLPEGPTLMQACEGCQACREACPTDAIREDQILVSAHRCLAYVNERSADWPGWVSTHSHHCLMGCLVCQRVCPANPELPVVDTGICLSAQETKALLDGDEKPPPSVGDGLQRKLTWLGQPVLRSVLGRNLSALIASGQINPEGSSASALPARNGSSQG